MEEKVYLRIETPFSLKNPKTRAMALYIVAIPIGMAILVISLLNGNSANQELAKRLAIVFALWFTLGGLPCAVMIFNSYVKIVDGDLVCNKLGFREKRYPRQQLQKAVSIGNRIEIIAAGKTLVTLPASGPARHLISRLRLRLQG